MNVFPECIESLISSYLLPYDRYYEIRNFRDVLEEIPTYAVCFNKLCIDVYYVGHWNRCHTRLCYEKRWFYSITPSAKPFKVYKWI